MKTNANINRIVRDLDNGVIKLEDLDAAETKALEHKFGNQLISNVICDNS